LNDFWAERFLTYPNRPGSGPLKVAPQSNGTPINEEFPAEQPTGDEPVYSATGISGAWMPFGGGRHQCPGKNFAKQEIITCTAIMTTLFDIELDPAAKLETDTNYYGLGSLPLKGKVACRIRRRQITQ
jgi:cytochrome P450